MGQFFEEIPDYLITWIKQQKMFWVASAPLHADGHVNVSPKGFAGTFRIVNSRHVWYEDMSGSGIETISHLKENRRITILFHAFEGPPRIARLFGTGTVYEFSTPEYEQLLPADVHQPGSQAVIMVDVHKVGTSCGFSIPFYTFKAPRMLLHSHFARAETVDIRAETADPDAEEPPRPKGGVKGYWKDKNAQSIDGLPGLAVAHASMTKFKESGPFPQDDVRISSKKAPLPFDTKSAMAFLFGILASIAFLQLRAHIISLLSL